MHWFRRGWDLQFIVWMWVLQMLTNVHQDGSKEQSKTFEETPALISAWSSYYFNFKKCKVCEETWEKRCKHLSESTKPILYVISQSYPKCVRAWMEPKWQSLSVKHKFTSLGKFSPIWIMLLDVFDRKKRNFTNFISIMIRFVHLEDFFPSCF